MWEKSKGITQCDKRTVTCDVGTAQCEDETVKCEKKKKSKETTKCEKITVIWVVGIAQRKDETVKYEKNITWYNRLSTSRYYITFFFGAQLLCPLLTVVGATLVVKWIPRTEL